MKIWRCSFLLTGILIAAVIVIVPTSAQVRPTSGGANPTGGSSGNTNSPGGNSQGNPSSTNPGIPASPVYFSGRVMLDDGNPAPLNVTIRRTCSGNPRAVAYTDSKGRFSFRLGDSTGVLPDASESDGGSGRFNPTLTNMSTMATAARARGIVNPAMGCDLTAVASGYNSDRVNLSSDRFLDNGDVGVIVLHRIAGVEGRSISVTSLAAPKDAVKAYEKGSQALLKNKPADAEKDLGKAVELYPKYANAWFDLGRVRLAEKNLDGARDAFVKALEADDKLVGPYVELGQIAAREQKWEDTAKYLDRALALDPVDYPQLWYIDGVANFDRRHIDAAERSAREAMKSDPQEKNPAARQLLGLVLDLKGDATGALEAYHEFLRLDPNGADAEKTRQRVVQLEGTAKTN